MPDNHEATQDEIKAAVLQNQPDAKDPLIWKLYACAEMEEILLAKGIGF